MKIEHKKYLLLGSSILALSFMNAPEAYSQTTCPSARTNGVGCPGTESRLVQCRDFRGNVVADSFCARLGMRPDATRKCTAVCPPPPPPGDGDGGDGDGSSSSGDGDGADPLIFDMDGNGVSLSSCANGVMFDIDNDGKLDQTGWTDGRDGLLAIDRNGNGKIDSQSELFGNIVDAAYQHLANHDSNADGKIDRHDDVWPQLKMWVDRNKDGITDPGELETMGDIRMESINVNYDTVNEINAGSNITAAGTFTRIMHGGKKVVNRVVEVFLDFFSS